MTKENGFFGRLLSMRMGRANSTRDMEMQRKPKVRRESVRKKKKEAVLCTCELFMSEFLSLGQGSVNFSYSSLLFLPWRLFKNHSKIPLAGENYDSENCV